MTKELAFCSAMDDLVVFIMCSLVEAWKQGFNVSFSSMDFLRKTLRKKSKAKTRSNKKTGKIKNF